MPTPILAKEVPQPTGPQWIAWGIEGMGIGVVNGRAIETLTLVIGSGQGDGTIAVMVKPHERIKLVLPEPVLGPTGPSGPSGPVPVASEIETQKALDATEAAKLREVIDAGIAVFAKNTGRSL